MKWFKKFEDFRKDDLEYEKSIDENPYVVQMEHETEDEEKDEEKSDSYVDKEGVIQISDWEKY